MKKGSIINQIVKEISLENYEDDTALSQRVEWALKNAIPNDIREWFMGEITGKPLTGRQGLQLVRWLFLNPQKAIINKGNIKRIRRARQEWILDTLRSNLPSPAVMANVTEGQLSSLNCPERIKEELIPWISQAIKRDKSTVTVAVQWALNGKHLSIDDLIWLVQYIAPSSEIDQLMLREGPIGE